MKAVKHDLLKDIFKRTGHNIDNKSVAADGFVLLQGLLAGVAVNDIWRILNLPGNHMPMIVAGKPGTFDQDFVYQSILAAAAAGAQIFLGIDHGISFAAGMMLGLTWANLSEKGQYIGAAPAHTTDGPKPPPSKPLPPPPNVQLVGQAGTPLSNYNPMQGAQVNQFTLT